MSEKAEFPLLRGLAFSVLQPRMEPPVASRPTSRRIQRSVATGFRAYMPPPSGPSRLSSYPPRPLADLPEIFLSPCPPCELVRTETWGHSTLWPAPSSSPYGGRFGIRLYRAVFPGVIFLYAIYRPLSISLLTFVRLLSILIFTSDGEREQPWQTPASSGKRRSYPRYPLGMAALLARVDEEKSPSRKLKRGSRNHTVTDRNQLAVSKTEMTTQRQARGATVQQRAW